MNKSSAKRVTPMSFTQQTTNSHFRGPSVSPMSSVTPIPSDANLFSLPKLITYDIFERKSVQQLLYESAQERDNAEHKWKKFNSELERHLNAKQYSKHLIKTLDDTKQWAALHYAVFNNNRYVCDQLTDKKSGDKRFRCDINILTGNGENVLHIAARSSFLWETPSSMKSIENIVPVYGNPVRLPAIICTLIDRGADVNHADDEGRTPLHLAVMQNRLPFVKYLLTKKVDLYAATKLYFNVLHFTFIPNGQTQAQLSDMFEYIIEKLESSARELHFPWKNQKTNLAQMHTVDNRTPLVLALAHPETNDSIIRRLLKYMKDYSEDFFYQSSSEKNIYQTQIFIAIEQVARRQLYTRVIPWSSYHHLQKYLQIASNFHRL